MTLPLEPLNEGILSVLNSGLGDEPQDGGHPAEHGDGLRQRSATRINPIDSRCSCYSFSLAAAKNSVPASLSAVYRQGPFSLGAEGCLREVLDVNAREYAGRLTVGVRF